MPDLNRSVLVTDYAWNSLDPEREILKEAGADLVVAESGDEDELAQLAVGVDGILTCWKSVTEKVIRNASKCQSIGRYGIGLDNIDVSYATEVGIVVTNVPAYCLPEVSDHALALLISWARKVTAFDHAIKSGTYNLKAQMPIFRLEGRTLGIAGYGKIGRTLARKALALGLKVIAFDPYLDLPKDGPVEQVEFDVLLNRSHYISMHVPSTPETRHLFNREAFRKMNPEALVINTARGDLIDEEALLEALDTDEIAGAALDVLSQEPPDPDHPLIRHPKVLATPHAAFYSEESLLELQRTAAAQMRDVFLGKRPEYVVNPDVLKQGNLRAGIGNRQ